MKEHVPNAKFYVFSDDKDFAKEYAKENAFEAINLNNTLSDLEELFLMSACKHQIIANSSFSWWASWLNKNEDKIIVAPNKWLNGVDMKDIYTDQMICL